MNTEWVAETRGMSLAIDTTEEDQKLAWGGGYKKLERACFGYGVGGERVGHLNGRDQKLGMSKPRSLFNPGLISRIHRASFTFLLYQFFSWSRCFGVQFIPFPQACACPVMADLEDPVFTDSLCSLVRCASGLPVSPTYELPH